MRMYQFKNILFLLITLLLYCCNSSNKNVNPVTPNSKKEKKPNIIYILADDLGYGDVGIYGQTKFNTPNIDKLAQNGMLFTQHYSGSTVCAPSRSALMTGMHTGHTAIRGNKEIKPEGQHPIPDQTFTIAEQLKEVGYTTGAFGKWGLGFPKSEGDPTLQGFDTFFGYNCQRLGHHYYPHHLWHNNDSIVLQKNKGHLKGTYAPKLIHEKTIEFIEKNKDTSFFAYVASVIPHAELAAPENILKAHSGKYNPETPYIGTDDGPKYRQGAYESQKEPHAAFAAMVEILDNQVGEIVKKIKELGLEDNTIIIFTSDNGPHKEGGADPEYFNSNGKLRGFKRDLYEGGIRVPMIASWPGKIQPGTKTNHISAFWDVFPTLSDIAETNTPENIDGISFLPTLIGDTNSQKNHDYLYWEFHERGGRQAVRKGNWKAVKYNVLKKGDSKLQLYDLSTDIGEKHNIAAQHPEIVKEMEQILKEARTNSDVFTFNQTAFLNVK